MKGICVRGEGGFESGKGILGERKGNGGVVGRGEKGEGREEDEGVGMVVGFCGCWGRGWE